MFLLLSVFVAITFFHVTLCETKALMHIFLAVEVRELSLSTRNVELLTP